MREHRPPARGFPFQRRAQPVGLAGDQHKIAEITEIFRSGFGQLRRGRKMDVAIGQINRRACGLTCGAKSIPFGAKKDLIYHHKRLMPCRVPAVKRHASVISAA